MSESTIYTFSSAPKVVLARSAWSSKRDLETTAESTCERRPKRYHNVMIDPRVVRGITCAKPGEPTSNGPESTKPKKKKQQKRKWRGSRWKLQNFIPPPIEPTEVNLSFAEMLEKLYPVEECDLLENADEETQTDDFLDRPPIPDYLPVKTGVDNWAQVILTELFDFDFEVRPILDVLIMKTVDYALQEVREEDELAHIRVEYRKFEELRKTEAAEIASLEERERRIGIEKQYRLFKRRDALEKERQLTRKIAACAYSHCCHQGMKASVLDLLTSKGFMYNPVEREVELEFMKEIYSAVDQETYGHAFSRRFLDLILVEEVFERNEMYSAWFGKEATADDHPSDGEDERSKSGETGSYDSSTD